LIEEGIKFTILAPSQAERCRPIDDPHWQEVGGGQIDSTRPYRCFLQPGDPNSPYLDVFFYDGPISRDMGFDSALSSSHNLAGRLGQAVRGDHRPTQIISVATDGETFGHHKGGTEKCLAYAFTQEFPQKGWTVTNFAHYLSLNPPTWEVELKPVTAWSCAHGVGRWQDDCGCANGGGWHQKWRRPLRDALDWLRDQLIRVYEEAGKNLFDDPWLARDEYVQVVRDRDSVQKFLARHQSHRLNGSDRLDALRLLEMQRHALLMYTSCGWFFEELSRPEGVQILRYASRALELAGDVAGVQLEKNFIRRLTSAPSNVECFKNGAEVYRQLVIPAQITFEQVAAHYAISSLFTSYAREHRVYCYSANQLDYQIQHMGSVTLAIGQLELTSEITQESQHFVFAVLHLCGWDFHCCIQPFAGRRNYSQMKEQLSESLSRGSAAQTILKMNHLFGDVAYSLQDLFAEERHRIMRLLSQETLTRLDQLYTQVYRDNYGVLMAFHRDGLTVPPELQVAAEIALGHRLLLTLRSLEQEADDLDSNLLYLGQLEAIATEATHLRCQLHQPEAREILQRFIERSLWTLFNDGNVESAEAQIRVLERLVMLSEQFRLGVSFAKSQELFHQWLHRSPQITPALLDLANKLAIVV
jgi:alpha-amylase/alpha-mannosidase (GH57 family)